MILSIGSNYFRIIPAIQLYGWFGKYVPTKLSFPFYKERLLFGDPLNTNQNDLWFA